MSDTLVLGAVAYDPKVVTIWEGMRRYFHEEVHLPVEVVLFQSYEAQVSALLASPADPMPRIDIAWNTNLAYLQAEEWSRHECRPIAMRDTDIDWRTKIVAVSGGPIASLADLKNRVLALGSRDSGHAAILPVHFLDSQGMTEGRDYRTVRFNSDVGKHGDTGTSELEVLKALHDGRADAGAVGDLIWVMEQAAGRIDASKVEVLWTTPPFDHCMFDAMPSTPKDKLERFQKGLFSMEWENPKHRRVLELEGLKKWMPPREEGYASLHEALDLDEK